MADEYTGFWLALLDLGDNAEDQKRNWNQYFARWAPSPLKQTLKRILSEMGRQDLSESMFGPPSPDPSERAKFEQLANKHGGHPELPSDPNFVGPAVMDFSKHQFKQSISFAGRLLLFPSFDNATFAENADFRNAVFGGRASFDQAAFQASSVSVGDGNLFEGAIFMNTASFKAASFSGTANFRKAKFRAGAYFDGAEFRRPLGGALFTQSEFSSEASFENADFAIAASFDRARFCDKAGFHGATFDRRIIFNNAKFEAETSFRKALFRTPPRFFEAELYEDADLGDVDWKIAEASYSRPSWKDLFVCRPGIQHEGPTENPADAVRAWDRLALIMNRFEKPHERHTFYRLRMRAQRQTGKLGLLSMVNRLFDVICDYGWGLPQAFLWWAGHMAVFAVILAAYTQSDPFLAEHGCDPALGESLLVSFANAHAILGLGSQYGYLQDVRECLASAVQPEWVMTAVGTAQAVIGPVLLFLLLLTARNRFRLG